VELQELTKFATREIVLISIRMGYGNPTTPTFTMARVGGETSTTYRFTNTKDSEHRITLDLNNVSLFMETGSDEPVVFYIP